MHWHGTGYRHRGVERSMVFRGVAASFVRGWKTSKNHDSTPQCQVLLCTVLVHVYAFKSAPWCEFRAGLLRAWEALENTLDVIRKKNVISLSNKKKIKLKPFVIHLEAHKVKQPRCFSFIILLATPMTNMSSNFHRFVIYFKHHVEIHQVDVKSLTITKGVKCL